MIFCYKVKRCTKLGHHDFKKCFDHHELNGVSLGPHVSVKIDPSVT
jgi:hypothetical protein